MRNLYAPGNQWAAKVERLQALLNAANDREAELRGRVHELELLLAALSPAVRVDGVIGRSADTDTERR